MSPFRFRLEQVLRYRIQLQDQAQQQLAKVSLLLQQEREKLQTLLAELHKQQQRLGAGDIQADELWLVQNYLHVVQGDIVLCHAKIRALEEAVDAARQQLLHRAKERELLEKLKEKQAARYMQEEKLAEQRLFDETATIRSYRESLQNL